MDEREVEAKRRQKEKDKEEFDRMFYELIKDAPNAPTFEQLKEEYDSVAVDIIVKTEGDDK